jgi:hypothetical protein
MVEQIIATPEVVLEIIEPRQVLFEHVSLRLRRRRQLPRSNRRRNVERSLRLARSLILEHGEHDDRKHDIAILKGDNEGFLGQILAQHHLHLGVQEFPYVSSALQYLLYHSLDLLHSHRRCGEMLSASEMVYIVPTFEEHSSQGNAAHAGNLSRDIQ